ncbi:MAG TPA: UDP-N-acetylglucosamine 2-epimerase (non-hydrolyzing) [Candidatus Saccharicenans sp.]|jgi:UDP-N-acetylglucosamine 2-epimerase (non-hydrolysing)|nr:UDP-N-acetylglucosamine 2-epimerase (non-hydrolyzing) [Candidatus Saccharicenans sp.]HRD02755.1 UDP-N-acetylglucosamine 2-epimerase (non-hydrolyzing) [Candidatus Saccharicenans sp.]
MKILMIAGARPNFMKIAPLVKAIHSYNNESKNKTGIKQVLVHTGQHYDHNMSDIFFRELGIPAPDFNLGVGSGSQAEQTAKIMLAFEPVCQQLKPNWVVVVGDVNSTLACSLVAAKLGLRIAHVEAGLRSFDSTMPEEINRVVTDRLSDLLFTPSTDANLNLRKEGVPTGKIKFVGNIMIDALIYQLRNGERSQLAEQLNLKPRQFAYITLHRPSNVDNPETLKAIMKKLVSLSRQMTVVFPVHPRTRKNLLEINFKSKAYQKLKLIEPIGYSDSLWLAKNASLVLTDSGGLQEETTYFKTPCLTLRANTERPITIKLGTNKLTDIRKLDDDIKEILEGKTRKGKIPRYWDGLTAQRIVRHLVEGARDGKE